jgi:hypothetical protein
MAIGKGCGPRGLGSPFKKRTKPQKGGMTAAERREYNNRTGGDRRTT